MKKEREYYEIGINMFARGYAYSDYENDSLDYNLIETCPLCGSNISGASSKQPYKMVLSTQKKIGDFIFGLFHYIVVSPYFKEEYEKSGMTGIKEFRKIERVRVRKEILEIELYAIIIDRVNVRPEPIIADEINKNRQICQLCNPYGKFFIGEEGLKMNLNGQEGTPNIFMTYTRGMGVYCDQGFVDFCKDKRFTNFEKHICKFEDHNIKREI